jgi:hypothetical protein
MIAFIFYENCAAQRALGQALALPAVLALGALAFKLQADVALLEVRLLAVVRARPLGLGLCRVPA